MLVWLFAGNLIAAVVSPFFLASMRRDKIPDFPDWVAQAIGGCSAACALFALAVFRWKRWGFYGYALGAVAIVGLNVYAGLTFGAAALGLVGTAVLFGTLQIGGRQKGWSQLE